MIEQLIKTLIDHPVWLSLIGPFLFGGETILLLSILAGQGVISLPIVIIFCALGMFLADLMWFSIGKLEALSRLKKYKWVYKGYKKAKREIEDAPSQNFLFILIKFAYGIGVPILMYFGRKGMKYREFVLKNSIIIGVWSTSIVILGWTIGKTSAIAFRSLKNIYASIGLIITGIILVHILFREVRDYLIKKEKMIKKHGKNIRNKV